MDQHDLTSAGDALALVNVARQAFGLPTLAELPAGTTGNSQDCVLARAFRDIRDEHATVSDSITFGASGDSDAARTVADLWATTPNGGGYGVKTPGILEGFISAFDNHRLPTLDVDN